MLLKLVDVERFFDHFFRVLEHLAQMRWHLNCWKQNDIRFTQCHRLFYENTNKSTYLFTNLLQGNCFLAQSAIDLVGCRPRTHWNSYKFNNSVVNSREKKRCFSFHFLRNYLLLSAQSMHATFEQDKNRNCFWREKLSAQNVHMSHSGKSSKNDAG